MQKKSTFLYATLACMLTGNIALAQQVITGKITDGKHPIAGATILVSGSKIGTSSDANGNFTLKTEQNTGQLEIKYIGHTTQSLNFSNNATIGTIILIPTADQSLDEIVIVGKGVIDIAEGRQTPIAVSTIRQQEIEEKVGAQDITAVLANTPSVYITSQARGFGESSMTTRGFDQSNTAFLLNGQPINGMDNGRVYWSNWNGLSDIASVVQIQRGLGSSKLAISSVGGTTNFVTKSTDMREGGFFKRSVANDMYRKSTLAYNTGLLKSGFAVSVMFTDWRGDGYMDKTEGAGQNYFLSVGYKVNEKHNLNLMVTGAPQWHNTGYTSKLSNFLKEGRKYNDNIQTLNGIEMNPRKNFYHKPVSNFNWDWKISDKSSLATVVYASMARGGGQSYQKVDKTYLDPLLVADVNNHQWYGIVSNYNRQLNENLNFNFGFDLRDYKGEHYRQATDLLGKSSIKHQGNVNLPGATETSHIYTTNPWKTWGDRPKNAEDRLGWDYNQIVRYGGVFGQIEYAKNGFTAFFQGSASQQHNVRKDYYTYKPGEEKSDDVNNFGYNVKGGVSYTLNQHTLFGNAGIYSRQPYQNNIFMNYRNDINEYAENEEIIGLELGYKFTSKYFEANLNAYRTTWDNRVTGSTGTASDKDVKEFNPNNDPNGLQKGDYTYLSNYGVKQIHQGLELDFVLHPFKDFQLKGFGSLGDWKYDGNAVTIVRNESREELGRRNRDLSNVHVGDAAQTSYGAGVKYSFLKGLSVDADYRRFERLYGALPKDKPTLKLPDYDLVDAGISYKLQISHKNTLSLRANINNLFNKLYITDATSNADATATSEYWNGIETSNYVLMGWGRTWNGSIKMTF
ncbi:TonB-dependent receptor [Sphingobacterium faecale]|uniref:TonB-dependent receptor n=1 Tax=Sphingobacterium faecale TaxID=2803775 RepID=A0ABS1R153_9SPHI|nr:TonB-dependent receptor [Sphingobacterium faecale]MBL1408398.1 TonB-dependent receptor [Sphingobacterium faecale]